MIFDKLKKLDIVFDSPELDCPPVFSNGDVVSGRVVLDLSGVSRVDSLKLHAEGFAKVHWTESRSAGSSTAYTQNYSDEVEYLNRREVLLQAGQSAAHERGWRAEGQGSLGGSLGECHGCLSAVDGAVVVVVVVVGGRGGFIVLFAPRHGLTTCGAESPASCCLLVNFLLENDRTLQMESGRNGQRCRSCFSVFPLSAENICAARQEL